VKREGRQGVGSPHSTGEVGELDPPGPDGGKGETEQGIVGGKRGDTPRSGATYTQLRRVAVMGSEVPALTSGCPNRASPDLWEPRAGQPPGPPG